MKVNREILYLAIAQADERYIDEATADIAKGRHRPQIWLRWGAIAACAALLVLTPVARLATNLGRSSSSAGNGGVSTAETTDGVMDNGATADAAEEYTWEDELAEGLEPTEGAGMPETEQESEADSGYTFGQELYVPEGKIVTSSQALADSSSTVCYTSPEDGTWFYKNGVEQALKQYEGQDVVYFLAVELFQNLEPVDVDSLEGMELLSQLAQRGYTVGIAEVEENGETERYAAGYFSAEDLEKMEGIEDFGFVLYFRSEENRSTADGLRLLE